MNNQQLTEAYQAARRLLTHRTKEAVLNGKPSVFWEPDGSSLTWERQLLCDGTRKTETVRISLPDGTETVEPDSMPDARAESSETDTFPAEWSVSPDRRRALFFRNYNLILRDLDTGAETPLTTDAKELCRYGCYIDIYSQITVRRQGYVEHPLVCWSPDGRYFITYRADRRKTRSLSLIEACTDREPDLRPRLHQYPCPFAADPDEELPHYRLYAGDVQNASLVPVDIPEYLNPVFTSENASVAAWLDGSTFYATWEARGHREARLYLADASDGSSRLLLRETTDRFFNLGAFGLLDGFGPYLYSNFVTKDRRFAFWQSERSGYAHLYRYRLDTEDGEGTDLFGPEHASLIVQKILRVDQEQERIYFMGNNDPDCSDPLYYQLYAADFQGTFVKRLTPEDGLHQISMGPNAFVDTWSRVDCPPVTCLRSLEGDLICRMAEADISPLLELGYQMPEPFTVTAADGHTKLHGILIRPADFDPDRTYPVIDSIYGGAQLYNVPRGFTWDNAQGREILGGLQSLAQLGFAGIILDGRGTPGRGMDFHSFSLYNIHGCAGLEDHAFCLKELKEKYPFLDLDRVGMWGNSAGGYATVSAMFLYPDIYKAGVASSGNYDQRMYEHSWTERYYGLYQEELYEKGDITARADGLKGHLMLACGAMDDNVSMAQTLRLCDALNRCGKTYDLVMLPRCNHNVPADPYFVKRKIDFFVTHLLDEQPVSWKEGNPYESPV